MKIISALLLLGALLTGAYAQRPRSMDPQPAAQNSGNQTSPKTVKAKYEGGVFGYRKTMEGTLTFDDANNRLLFKDKKPPKEISIPYEAIMSAFADTQKRRRRGNRCQCSATHLRLAGAFYQNQGSLSDDAIQRSGFEGERHHKL